MDTRFTEWLLSQMKDRGWSQSELARAAGLTRQAISYYLSGNSKSPDEAALSKLARAFKLPPDQVFRAAGLLPPNPGIDPMTEQIIHIVQQLDERKKKRALKLIQVVAEEGEASDVPQRKRKTATSG